MKSGAWIGSALLVVGAAALALWRAGVFTPDPPKRELDVDPEAACRMLETPAFERAVVEVTAATQANDPPALARALTELDAAMPAMIPLALARPLGDLRKAARALPPLLSNPRTASDPQVAAHLESLGAAMSSLGETCRDNPGP